MTYFDWMLFIFTIIPAIVFYCNLMYSQLTNKNTIIAHRFQNDLFVEYEHQLGFQQVIKSGAANPE